MDLAIKKEKISGKTVLRLLHKDDYERVKDIQINCFPEMMPWSLEQWQAMIVNFPRGK